MSELLGWWLLVEALGIAGLPLTVTVFSRLPDRGWSATKALALLAVGWLIWFPLTIITALPFSRAWIIGTMLVFALANIAMLRAPSVRLALTKFIQTQRGYIVASEVVFAGAFGLMAWVRSFTPEVVDTEKFMDVAFLSSIWRAPHLPPPDPWLSGETINYYYFGHYLMALLAKALGTPPATAFNLAIALIFALTAVVVFGLATNIVAAMRHTREASLLRYIPAGLASVFFVLIAGNLAGAQQWWKQATQLAAAWERNWRIPGRSGCDAISGRNTTGGRRRASSGRATRLTNSPPSASSSPTCMPMCWRCLSPRWRSSSRSTCCSVKVKGLPHSARHAGAS